MYSQSAETLAKVEELESLNVLLPGSFGQQQITATVVEKPAFLQEEIVEKTTPDYKKLLNDMDSKFTCLENCPLLATPERKEMNGPTLRQKRRRSVYTWVFSADRAIKNKHLPLSQPRLQSFELGSCVEDQHKEACIAFNTASQTIFKDLLKCMESHNEIQEGGQALVSRIVFNYAAIRLKDNGQKKRHAVVHGPGAGEVPQQQQQQQGSLLSMRDEIFLQLMKQLQLNPSGRSFLKGWRLLKSLIQHQGRKISVELLPFVKTFVLAACVEFSAPSDFESSGRLTRFSSMNLVGRKMLQEEVRECWKLLSEM
jgi:hypothetical protein